MVMSTAGMTNAARIEVAKYLESIAESLTEAAASNNQAITEDIVKDLDRTVDALRSTLVSAPTTTITSYDAEQGSSEGGMTIKSTGQEQAQ